MNTWTNEKSKAWDAVWAQEFMQDGLRELERRCRPTPIALPSGQDALVLAAGEHHRRIGQQEVLQFIEDMRREKKEIRSLPRSFSAEARRETQPQ